MEKQVSGSDTHIHRRPLISTILDRRTRGFARYVPVAEKMLCLASQTPTLRRREENIIGQVIAGTSMQNIGKREGVSRQLIHQIEHRALSKMFYEYPLLVSKFNEFKRPNFIPNELPSITKGLKTNPGSGLEAVINTEAYKQKQLKRKENERKRDRAYYHKNRERLLAKRRKKYKNPKIRKKILASSKEYYKQNRARIIKRQRKYGRRPDVRMRRIKYMEEYHQRERENKILF